MTKKPCCSPKSTTAEISNSTDTRLVEALELIAASLKRSADSGEKMIELHRRGVKASERMAADNITLETLLKTIQ